MVQMRSSSRDVPIDASDAAKRRGAANSDSNLRVSKAAKADAHARALSPAPAISVPRRDPEGSQIAAKKRDTTSAMALPGTSHSSPAGHSRVTSAVPIMNRMSESMRSVWAVEYGGRNCQAGCSQDQPDCR